MHKSFRLCNVSGSSIYKASAVPAYGLLFLPGAHFNLHLKHSKQTHADYTCENVWLEHVGAGYLCFPQMNL